MLLAAAALATAVVPTPPGLAPTGPWVVEAEDNLCLLSRNYGPPEARITVGFQPLFAYEKIELIVLTSDTDRRQQVGEGSVTVGERSFKADYYSLLLPDGRRRFTRVTVDRAVMDLVAGAPAITIRAKPVATTVQIVAPGKALATFQTCQTSLLVSWGIDPRLIDNEHRPRLLGIGRGFGPEAYPKEAARAGISGRVVAVLQISADGRVTNCRAVVSAGPALNGATCTGAQRLRFAPATDATGSAIASIYVLPVRWTTGSM